MKIFFSTFCVFFLLTENLFANTERPLCSLQLLCNQLKDRTDFLVADALGEKEVSPESFEKVQRIFNESKNAILQLLHRKKNLLPLDAFQRLIQDVTTVSLGRFDEPAMRKLFYGACNRPNAIYIKGMHRILVCPVLIRFPELTLHQILAHEFGHVIQKLQKAIRCFQKYPTEHLDETFADWVASKVVSEKLIQEKDPKVAQQNAFDSQLLFLSLACEKSPGNNADWARSHPSLQNRVEKIFLAQPAFQDALQCEYKLTKTCG